MILCNVCVDTGWKCIGSLRNAVCHMFEARDWNHGGYIDFLETGEYIRFESAFKLLKENLNIDTGEDLNKFFDEVNKNSEDKEDADNTIEFNLYCAIFPDSDYEGDDE